MQNDRAPSCGALLAVAALAFASCVTPASTFLPTQGKPLDAPARASSFVAGNPAAFSGYDFGAVDARAAKVSRESVRSMKSLVEYLTSGAANDLERVRSIFAWETQNIEYDGKAYSVLDIPQLDPEEVFILRKGVCQHYSVLFQRLADIAGLQALTIVGEASGYPKSILLKDTRHAWNAVKIDGAWYLLDVTWASGYLDQGNGFHYYPPSMRQQVYAENFLVDPALFVKSHYPEDEQWQLLAKPMKESEFLRIAGLRQ